MKTKTYFLLFMFFLCKTYAHAETFSIGTYIVNMGVTPQTVANGMKPYGLVYEFLKTYNIPIRLVIGAGKAKDSADFTYKGTKYKGGTFIIPKEYITTAVKARITYWKGQGVVMDTTTTMLTLTVTRTLTSAPKWTISNVNTSIGTTMFNNTGIPASAYSTKAPATIGSCDDILIMPHADPSWALHGNLYNWNRVQKGAIWSSCHGVSELESVVNPSNSSEQLNFLTTQGLINYGSHADGTPAYKYYFNRASYNGAPISANASDPVFQMMGIEDGAHTNGSEQIYIPLAGAGSGWRNTTKIGCYDSTHSSFTTFPNGPAAVTVYGRGFGLASAGYVMYQGGHDITGTGTANIAAMRQFFNFSLMAMVDKTPSITAYNIYSYLNSNSTYSFSVNATSPIGAALSYQWTTNSAGTFSSSTSPNTNFTTSNLPSDTTYSVTCQVTDACGRLTFVTVVIKPSYALPVKLLNFEAELLNTDAHLYWTSAMEEGLLSYEVQRSTDGVNFCPVANIQATGSTVSLNEYSYTDNGLQNLNHRVIYYRLKLQDMDGNYSLGPVIEVDLPNNGAGIVSLVPNPSSDVIFIELETSFSIYTSMEINDVFGRTIFSTDAPEMLNANTLKLDISHYANGAYFVNLKKKSGGNIIARFVKD